MTQVAQAPSFLRARFGGLPGAFWALWAGTLINRMGTMATPFMTLYLVSVRRLSIPEAGGVMAASGAGALLSQLLGGVLADRIGRRKTMLAATLSTSIILVALAHTRPIPVIVVLVGLLGITIESYRPAAQAMVADLVPEADRTRAYGLLFWAVNLGFATAMTTGGLLAKTSFTALFWTDALTGALFGLLVWRLIPGSQPQPRGTDTPGGFRRVIHDRKMLAFTLCVLAYAFVYFQCDSTLPLAMRAHGLSPSFYGMCMALNGILICVLQPLIGPWLQKRDPGRIWAAGAALLGIGFGLTAAAHTTAAYLATVAIWTVGETITAAVSGAIVAHLAPEHLRGRYAGLYGLAWSSGWLISSLLGTQLLSINPSALWITCTVLCSAAALALTALLPSRSDSS
ncbi:MDR family MFS transporter [Nonomuraea sp. NPDC050536]|uniref:MDR family MFS transporter n=1 Tax=Nonomuraea sp. NPDC050536 TaxID=3364366 RepID=UPI0037C5CBA9